MSIHQNWQNRTVDASQAVALIKSHMKIFVHGAAATPDRLLEALCQRTDIEDLTFYHLHTSGTTNFARKELAGRIKSVSLFTGPQLRKPISEGYAEFMPIFLSDIPGLFKSSRCNLDVALVQLSPPDKHGMCTLGTSVDAARAAVDNAKIVIAEINEQMPRTHGNTKVPLSKCDAFIHTDHPLAAHPPVVIGEVEGQIGQLIADKVDDGSTLQMGIGAIPDAVLARLGDKKDLGIHTEMFSDGLLPLVEGGVITNRYKEVHPGRIVTSFVSGSQKLYDFCDDNLSVEFHPCDRTNDVAIIRRNPKVVAINSAIEIDLTGQVCADSIGHRIYSGIGGQMDFIHGAAHSPGGMPIIALPSTAAKGTVSRITPTLKEGAGVVTTRGHVHWVATEYGMVNLHGLTLRERGEALISIAHPDFRAELSKSLREVRHYT